MSARRFRARWRHRLRLLGDQRAVRREAWRLERAVEDAVSGRGPVIVGPWLSEVGYEALYWAPFVRWVREAYRVAPERLVVVSRGGTASWYGSAAGRYVEVFDLVAPDEFAAALSARGAATGTGKQLEEDGLDRRVVAAVRSLDGMSGARILHPSLMYGLFGQFWSGQQSLGFVERQTRYARIAPPELDRAALGLPERYVAVKCHAARALPAEAGTVRQVRRLVRSVAARLPVVLLETGFRLDEHDDFALADLPGVTTLGGRLEPRTNLATQTAVVAGADAFVGTCGGLAWVAPLLGVDTTALMTDARLLHAHLPVARRVYHRLGAGAFRVVDLAGLERVGAEAAPATGPA